MIAAARPGRQCLARHPPGRIVGESGSGKTMLSLALMGLLPTGASRIAVMRAGQFVQSGPAERILREPRSPYTRELLAAVPEIPRRAKV